VSLRLYPSQDRRAQANRQTVSVSEIAEITLSRETGRG
jgi:hypothetical protein